jgi:succinate dehydrogenase/fumarate reductase cytochrome b subunit
MPSIGTWRKLQAVSGLVFAAFLILHLVSHMSLLGGWERGNATLLVVRKIYQSSLLEAVILGSVILHMISNVILYKMRQAAIALGKKKEGASLEPKELLAHRYTGYILTLFVIGHVLATRVVPVLTLGEDASLYDYMFVKLFIDQVGPLFTIYLLVFALAANWHLIYGTRSALATLNGRSVRGTPFPLSLKVLAMMAHVLVLFSVLSLAGYNYTIEPPEDHVLQAYTRVKQYMGMA